MSGDVKTTGNIKWTSDFWMETSTGWKICKSKKPSLKILESAKAKHMRLLKAVKARALRRSKARAVRLRRKRILAAKKKKWAAARKAARIRAAKKAAAKRAAAKRAAARRAAAARKRARMRCLTKGGWPGRKATRRYGGVVNVWGRKFSQKKDYYQIDWPVVQLSGTSGDGIWSLHGACGHPNGQDACNSICRSLTNTSMRRGWRVPCGKGYPSAATRLADYCTYKHGPVDARKSDWHGKYQKTKKCVNPMNHCQCQGRLPRCGRKLRRRTPAPTPKLGPCGSILRYDKHATPPSGWTQCYIDQRDKAYYDVKCSDIVKKSKVCEGRGAKNFGCWHGISDMKNPGASFATNSVVKYSCRKNIQQSHTYRDNGSPERTTYGICILC